MSGTIRFFFFCFVNLKRTRSIFKIIGYFTAIFSKVHGHEISPAENHQPHGLMFHADRQVCIYMYARGVHVEHDAYVCTPDQYTRTAMQQRASSEGHIQLVSLRGAWNRWACPSHASDIWQLQSSCPHASRLQVATRTSQLGQDRKIRGRERRCDRRSRRAACLCWRRRNQQQNLTWDLVSWGPPRLEETRGVVWTTTSTRVNVFSSGYILQNTVSE